LIGAGRTELLRVLFGIDSPLGGTVAIDGQRVDLGSARDAIRAGMALVPEDRKEQGLILAMALCENLSLATLFRTALAGSWINRSAEASLADRMIDRLQIRVSGRHQDVRFLSGGNQQKVVLGKWLALQPRILLLDEPTRGIDVAAKLEVYALMQQLAASEVAVLFASSEMEELLGVADRVLVMHQGRVAGALAGDQLTEQGVMELATGLRS
jgi:ribose transport system ATP-binding protein